MVRGMARDFLRSGRREGSTNAPRLALIRRKGNGIQPVAEFRMSSRRNGTIPSRQGRSDATVVNRPHALGMPVARPVTPAEWRLDVRPPGECETIARDD
jgi:hypothetical protein